MKKSLKSRWVSNSKFHLRSSTSFWMSTSLSFRASSRARLTWTRALTSKTSPCTKSWPNSDSKWSSARPSYRMSRMPAKTSWHTWSNSWWRSDTSTSRACIRSRETTIARNASWKGLTRRRSSSLRKYASRLKTKREQSSKRLRGSSLNGSKSVSTLRIKFKSPRHLSYWPRIHKNRLKKMPKRPKKSRRRCVKSSEPRKTRLETCSVSMRKS